MCKTKPNIFHTTSLNRDLHHPNIHKGCMWRGPTDLPTDLRVRLELRSTFWNHEHTLTWLLPLPAFEGENTQPWTPLEEQEKKPNGRSKDIKRIHKYFRSWRSQTCQARKSSILIGSIQKLTVFSTNKPFTASVRISSSVIPSATFDKPSLVQQSLGIQLKRALNPEHTKVSWEQTY